MIQLTARGAPPHRIDIRLAVNPAHIARVEPMGTGCDLVLSTSPKRVPVTQTYDEVIVMLGYEPVPAPPRVDLRPLCD